MKRRYCIFSAQFLPHMGGVENYTYRLAKELVKKGNEVTVVTSNVERVKSFEKLDGVTVLRVPCWNLMAGRFPVLKPDRVFWKMNRWLFQKKYDLVIVNTRFYVHSLYGLLFGRKKKIRTIFIEHGTSHMTVHQPILDCFEKVTEHLLTLVEKCFCKEFYGVSEACLEWLKHFHIE